MSQVRLQNAKRRVAVISNCQIYDCDTDESGSCMGECSISGAQFDLGVAQCLGARERSCAVG